MWLTHQEFLRRFEQHIAKKICQDQAFRIPEVQGIERKASTDSVTTVTGTTKTETQNPFSDKNVGKIRQGYFQMSLLR